MAAPAPGVVRGLLRELRGWARFLLPGNRYVAAYYPTPLHVARAMLRLAGVTPADTVCDLGCGDGRILLLAAEEFGAAGLGVELDPQLAAAAATAVAARNLQSRVRIVAGDAAGLDVGDATVLALYLSDAGNRALLDGVVNLRPGARVVSLYFPVQGWERQLVRVDRGLNIDKYLYVVKQGQEREAQRQQEKQQPAGGS